MKKFDIKGSKLVEIPYLRNGISNISETDSVLIIGEREAGEGILQSFLDFNFSSCECVDICPLVKDSALDDALKSNRNISFEQLDFLDMDNSKKFDYIACINVLEHFGMNFSEVPGFSGTYASDDYVRWNHDLRAIEKMIDLLSETVNSKIIITVPAGQPIMAGDINPGNKMPFLRRYDDVRIGLIEDIVKRRGLHIDMKFYYSDDYVNWYESGREIVTPVYSANNNPYSPNMIFAFTIKK
jgi:hypothetical protein